MTAIFHGDKVKAELNQYWYSPTTIWALTEEIALHGTSCAFLSTPSLFFALDDVSLATTFVEDASARDEHVQRRRALRQKSRLFEFDKQWSTDAAYTFYDFRYPDQIPVHYIGSFDYVVADPPFITEDVWEQYMRTVKMLLKKDGKVLFTTVLENHTMLEALWDGPLFIPPFFPLVEHLTYQYVCYSSYPTSSAMLQGLNPEVHDVDKQVLAAIRMANDLRISEKAFASQMATRDRDGEQRLPTAAYDDEEERSKAAAAAPVTAAASASPPVAPEEIPIARMRWSHIPDGLTMYPDGATQPPTLEDTAGSAAPSNAAEDVLSQRALALRANVESFKNGIDLLQKLLDTQMRSRHQRLKARKELSTLMERPTTASAETRTALESSIETLSKAVDDAEAERQSQLNAIESLAAVIEAEEADLLSLIASENTRLATSAEVADKSESLTLGLTPPTYIPIMRDCIASYRTVEVKRVPLQELAADATRKFKSPLFIRMKELLQFIKNVRKAASTSTVEAPAQTTV